MHYGCKANPFDENREIINVHRHTEVDLRQIEAENYEEYRKNYLPFDYTKAVNHNKVIKTKLDTDYENLKKVNNFLSTMKIKGITGRNQSRLKTNKTSLCNPVVVEDYLSNVQEKKSRIKEQLDTLLKKQKEIAREMNSKETSKVGYRKLIKEQSAIEKERKKLIDGFKQLLNVELKLPAEKADIIQDNTIKESVERRKIKSARKNLRTDIRNNDKELQRISNQRKVIIYDI